MNKQSDVSVTNIGIANIPNQRHRIVSKTGMNYNIMLVGPFFELIPRFFDYLFRGTTGIGKTSFINSLFSFDISGKSEIIQQRKDSVNHPNLRVTKAEIVEKGFKIHLNLIETQMFGDFINNENSWMPAVKFIDEQYAKHLDHEMQKNRKVADDLRVHVVLYFIEPTGHSLKEIDVIAMKELSSRVNLIPIIAKADMLTCSELAIFKDRIKTELAAQNINCYQSPVESSDEENSKRNSEIASAFPYAVIGSTTEIAGPDNKPVRVRKYEWGIAEVENDLHCDFKKLRSLLIRTHMLDLITSTDNHYEAFRSGALTGGFSLDKGDLEVKMKEEEEALRKRFTEQVKQEETRFRAWEKRLISERDRLNKNLESEHLQLKALQDEVNDLYNREKVPVK